jgi:hypothetical protein
MLSGKAQHIVCQDTVLEPDLARHHVTHPNDMCEAKQGDCDNSKPTSNHKRPSMRRKKHQYLSVHHVSHH